MYIDQNLEFSTDQAITATAISENVIDTLSLAEAGGSVGINGGATTSDLGQGNEPLFLVVVSNGATFTGTGTITVSLESSAAVGLTGATVHYTGPAVTATAITAGYRYCTIALPHGTYLRYLGLRYTCSGTPATGTFDAFLTTDPAGERRIYATGFSVQ